MQRVHFPQSYFKCSPHSKRFNCIEKFKSLTFQLRVTWFHTFADDTTVHICIGVRMSRALYDNEFIWRKVLLRKQVKDSYFSAHCIFDHYISDQKGQNSRCQKCKKSLFLITNFGRKFLCQKCIKTAFLTKFSGQK